MTDSKDPVLVAVDGSAGSAAAVRFAATEATRLGADLKVVHAALDFFPYAGCYAGPLPFSSAEFEEAGEAVVAEALQMAKGMMDPGRVTATLATGDAVFGILGAAGHARFIVLGANEASLLRRLAVGSTVSNVAARATVPVVVVPPAWVPGANIEPVLVAVKKYDAAPVGLIEAGLDRAEALGAQLRVVHVWEYPETYRDLAPRMLDTQEFAKEVDECIRADAAAAFDRHPEVDVEVVVRCGQPASELQAMSAEAGVLVIARRAHAFPAGHFGSTGRTLLRASRCPVEVLPIAEVAVGDGDMASSSAAGRHA